jgi:hypothetical protein
MWLTARELANELHLSDQSVTKLRRGGRLAYINLGTPKNPQYRYQLPRHVPEKLRTPPVERIGLLTYTEVGHILGTSNMAVRKMVSRGELQVVSVVRKRKMVTVSELRKVLALRDRRSGQAKQSYSPLLMTWLKGYLASKEAPVEVLDELIRTAAARAPLDQRSGYITRLWALFDEVNRLLKQMDGGPTTPGG